MLRHAAACGLSLLVPGCGEPTAPTQERRAPDKDFAQGALRIDLRHLTASGVEQFALVGFRGEPTWPGRRNRLNESLDWGDYRLSVYDPDNQALLFREGFDSNLDVESRSAATRISVRLPMPRRAIHAAIEKRRAQSAFQEIWNAGIDPNDRDIDRSGLAVATRVDTILASGDPGSKADIAILGDGYREAEYPKFMADAKRAAGYLFSVEPFTKRMRDFNVRSVFAPSAESGVTDPYLRVEKDTALRCAYHAGGSERSLAANDNHAVREIASAVPYDFVLILANARRYGGSSYFGGPAVVAIDSAAARYLVLHEFAHVIGGLADEYYIPTAQGPAFSGNIEPWNPNVTTAPDKGKWRDLLSGTALGPTPWNKTEYEKYFSGYVRRYFALRAARADEAVIEKFMRKESRRQAALLAKSGSGRKVGLFEGANGYARGAFRAEVNCIMFSLQTEYFCAACSSAIERMTDEHCL